MRHEEREGERGGRIRHAAQHQQSLETPRGEDGRRSGSAPPLCLVAAEDRRVGNTVCVL